jgi:peptidyl-prolyl cis-trans isomerase D
MFDFIRKHTKIMQFLLFLLIFPSFVLFGIDGYNKFREKGEPVAKVGGLEIFQAEWDNAHKADIDRLRASRPNVDIKLLDTPEARYRSLERLVRDRVLMVAVEKLNLRTSDAQLAKNLEANPAIAGLRRADGTLDMARYKELLAAQGMTPERFEASTRAELSTRQVLAGVGDTGFSPPSIAEQALNAYFERRSVQVALFKPSDFVAKVNPTPADLDSYYKDHATQFQAPEQAAIEYVVLDMDAVTKSIVPNEDDLKTYYKENAERLAGTEQRRASHILITAGKDMLAVERQKAKARADELLVQVKKAPATFAELAKKNSQDPGSGANGGDLDFFARGAMVKPFEDAAFAMKVGDISGVVESDFGYHIIKLTDLKAPKTKSFEEMKPELEAQVKKQLAQRKFAESAEAFSNGVYEQSDNLKSVAEKLKLEIRTAKNITRQPALGVTGVLANPKLLSAIFSTDSIDKKRNTEAVDLGANLLVSARITEYNPARTLPLAEVKDAVQNRLMATRSAELAKKEGLAKLAAWKANASMASYAEAVTVSRQDPHALPVQVVDAALRADGKALPVEQGVDLGGAGYAVVKVLKTLPRDKPQADAAKQEVTQYTREWTTAENLAYYELLKEQFKVKINVPKPAVLSLK